MVVKIKGMVSTSHGANAASEVDKDHPVTFVVDHTLYVMCKENWIVDSRATCYMSNEACLVI